ncbi:MAG: hypothetical protein ACJAS1_003455 [Oleiphilaceae bacterium]|jgi:hypothetical protein
MTEKNKARFIKLLSLLKIPGALSGLQETKAFEVLLSDEIKFFIALNEIPLDIFCKVLPFCTPICEDQKGFFKYRDGNLGTQFHWCFYIKESKITKFPIFVIYICTDNEDEEFGIIETHLQISSL